MPVNLQGRSFLKLLDFTPDEIKYLLDLSKEFKKLKLTRTPHKYLKAKILQYYLKKLLPESCCSFEAEHMIWVHERNLSCTGYISNGS